MKNHESVVESLSAAINKAKSDYDEITANLSRKEKDLKKNILYQGDNLELLKELYHSEKISLIYIDPPFFTGEDKSAVMKREEDWVKEDAYRDKWESLEDYLSMLTLRLMFMRGALSDDGLIYIHVDWHAVHYVRMLMDEIFGPERFVNEIIWQYKSGGSSKRRFSRKHDNILIYSKSAKYKFFPQKEKSYNRGLKPYRFKGVEEFRDETGWYTMVNMKDVWNIDMVGRTSSERTGYATQKPEKLMSRIIDSCTEEGDIAADLFCGSGSFGVAAAKLNRRFIMADSGKLAIDVTKKRLDDAGIEYKLLGQDN